MLDESTIKKIITTLASEFEVEESTITPEATIYETLDLDSLSLVDLVALIDDEFGVKIPTKDVKTIRTFEDLYNYIEKNRQ